ncbi:hypothetical protein E4633_07130 [Geomonas terrae]|uniref:Lipoprotein n=1 Tax=Geomonas terrae TaxID=2562681 RepID=A0A4S1CN47_9BACT|nr:hypothetical protein [Geomonas terrae]TGU75214.1 hypothetical protein E4633_07130 [Geomonas terrae]
MRVKYYQILSMLFFVYLLSGCGSARFDSTLRPSGDTQLTLSERFNIAGFTVAPKPKTPAGGSMQFGTNLAEMKGRARVLYPQVFVDDWSAVPVTATALTNYEPLGALGPMMTGFTLGLIPFPSSEHTDYEVKVSIVDEQGDKVAATPVKFTRENSMWMSLLGPLGCLPVPGRSLVPRDTVFFDLSGESYLRKSSELTTDSLIEALVTALKELPPERLAQVRKARLARLREIRIEGNSYWSVLTTAFSKGSEQEKADQFVLLLYGEKPRPDLQPLETAIVARRDGNGRWLPVSAYLKRTAKSLVSVTALLEGGIPGRLVVTEVSEPPLEDFLSVQTAAGDLETAEAMRWSNKVLLQAKNRSLPGLLQQKSTPDLLDLITQVENSFLDLNRMAETAKDRAQKAVADGGDGGTARELSLTCRERGDILKPILAAMKQEVARRGGK